MDGKLNVPKLDELPKIAENLALKNNTDKVKELSKLTKQKAIITGVPYAFSMLAMGFLLSAITRAWTQYRFNKEQLKEVETVSDYSNYSNVKMPNIFKEFER